MRVYPVPKGRNITLQYDISPSLAGAARGLSSFPLPGMEKELRRLPHIFSRVLELPFRSDADVSVRENRDCFRFGITASEILEGVPVRVIEIFPGITKIVVGASDVPEFSLDKLELDVWRCRLPLSTRPELTTANYAGGQLTVTVPKGQSV